MVQGAKKQAPQAPKPPLRTKEFPITHSDLHLCMRSLLLYALLPCSRCSTLRLNSEPSNIEFGAQGSLQLSCGGTAAVNSFLPASHADAFTTVELMNVPSTCLNVAIGATPCVPHHAGISPTMVCKWTSTLSSSSTGPIAPSNVKVMDGDEELGTAVRLKCPHPPPKELESMMVGSGSSSAAPPAPPTLLSPSYEFSTLDGTGHVGPTSTSAYAGTELDGQVSLLADGVQVWTVPATGRYTITAGGAQGGWGLKGNMPPGKGRVVVVTVGLAAGTKVKVLVGQEGLSPGNSAGPNPVSNSQIVDGGGGGGGTFVWIDGASLPLVVGGGGSGSGDGDYSCSGIDGRIDDTHMTNTNVGHGGSMLSRSCTGGGGGGWLSSGDRANGASDRNGYPGGGVQSDSGTLDNPNTGTSCGGAGRAAYGGFGGGGTAGYDGGGGGGGYTGGSVVEDAGCAGSTGSRPEGGSSYYGEATTLVDNTELSTNANGFVTVQLAADEPTFNTTLTVHFLSPSAPALPYLGLPGSEIQTWRASAGAPTRYLFSTLDGTGHVGPTSPSAYAGTELDGQVSLLADGVQVWTVPATGRYTITAGGAQGGWGLKGNMPPGKGRVVVVTVGLAAGTKVKVLVGQEGLSPGNSAGPNPVSNSQIVDGGGGGGGTFVWIDGASLPLVVGGGGSGSGDGDYSCSGIDGRIDDTHMTNTNVGHGGSMLSRSCTGGGGGGWLSSGDRANGASDRNGYPGGGVQSDSGTLDNPNTGTSCGGAGRAAYGGFGGGGTAGYDGGGGGGGYTGGSVVEDAGCAGSTGSRPEGGSSYYGEATTLVDNTELSTNANGFVTVSLPATLSKFTPVA